MGVPIDDDRRPIESVSATRTFRRNSHFIEVEIPSTDFASLRGEEVELLSHDALPPGATVCFVGERSAAGPRARALAEVERSERIPDTGRPTYLVHLRLRGFLSAPHGVSRHAGSRRHRARRSSEHARGAHCFLVIGTRRIRVELDEISNSHATASTSEWVDDGESGALCIAFGEQRVLLPCETVPSVPGRVGMLFGPSANERVDAILAAIRRELPKVQIIVY